MNRPVFTKISRNEKFKKEKKTLEKAFSKLQQESTHEIQKIRKEFDSLAYELNGQDAEVEDLREHVHNNSKAHYRDKISSLKKEIKKLQEEQARKDAKHVDEMEHLQQHYDYLNEVISPRTRSPTTSKSPLPRSSPRKTRPSSAPSSRFDPTEYVEQQKAKRAVAARKVRKPSPVPVPRPISVEKRRLSPRLSPREERYSSRNGRSSPAERSSSRERSPRTRKTTESYLSSPSSQRRQRKSKKYSESDTDTSVDKRSHLKAYYDSSDSEVPTKSRRKQKKFYESSDSESEIPLRSKRKK
jgi:hypothetical protein